MKKIQDGAAIFFIVCTAVLASISVLGVWEFFSKDVITKSFETIGLLAVVSVIIIFASMFIDTRRGSHSTALDAMGNPIVEPVVINPIFGTIRRMTVVILIVSVALLALLGVMSIWELLTRDIVTRSLSSMAVIAFSALIVVLTCLEREENKYMHSKNQPMSGGVIIIIGLGLLWMMASFM